MAESITIHFEGNEVGIQYHPATAEAELPDEMQACELALHALATKAIQNRQQIGRPVPEALTQLFHANTFQELL